MLSLFLHDAICNRLNCLIQHCVRLLFATFKLCRSSYHAFKSHSKSTAYIYDIFFNTILFTDGHFVSFVLNKV